MLNLKTFSKLLIMDTPPHKICQYCGKTSKDFSQAKLFLEHVRRHENIEADCDQCGKRWPTKKGLRDHKRDVHSEGYPCACCNRKFTKRSSLNRHLESRQMKCHLCFQYLKYMKQFFVNKTWNGTSRHFSYFSLHRARRLPTTYSTILWFGLNVAMSNLAWWVNDALCRLYVVASLLQQCASVDAQPKPDADDTAVAFCYW